MKLSQGDLCIIIGAYHQHEFVGKTVTLVEYYVSKEVEGFEGWHVDGIPQPRNRHWVVAEKHLMKISGGDPDLRLSTIENDEELCSNETASNSNST